MRSMAQLSGKPIKQLPLRKSSKPLRFIKKPQESSTGNEIWLLTLSDMLMLLLIFFVLLFALPFFQQSKPAQSRQQDPALQVQPVAAVTDHSVNQPVPAADSLQKEAVAALENDLLGMLGNQEGQQGVTVERRSQHVVLTFPEQIIFDSGQAQLNNLSCLFWKRLPSFYYESSPPDG